MLLRRPHLLVIPAIVAVGLAACSVKEVDDDDFTDSTGVQTGGGGDGGTGATGDFGGEGGIGAQGGGGTGVGGGTGGGECVGNAGVEDGSACTNTGKLPLAAGANACNGPPDYGVGGTEEPPGISVCERIYEVYKNGSADVFLACAAEIDVAPAFACDIDEVQTCVTEAHEATCPDQTVIDTCEGIRDTCLTFDPSDTSMGDGSTCIFLVTPFNEAGYAQWETCVTGEPQVDPGTGDTETCQVQVDRCWGEVAAVQ